MNKQAFVFLFLIALSTLIPAQVREKLLHSNWQFKQKGTTKYNPANVPGNIFTDLLSNQLIPDPFYANNETKLQWIENEDWEYQTKFNCDSSFLRSSNQELIFEGLDTYAKVYLNDSLLLQCDNMFRTWKRDVKNKLRKGENTLLILFESAVKNGKQEAQRLKYILPEGERVFTRKAQFQYGWDFAPRFVGCGIWKPVKLIAWNIAKINSWHYEMKYVSDSIAKIDLIVESNSNRTQNLTYQLNYTIKDNYGTRAVKVNKGVILKKGLNTDTISITIHHPKIWWSNGLGEANLYYFNLSLNDNKLKIDEIKMTIGLRTIELVNTKDSIGTSFYFKLNGVPVFMKGANYIPADIFLKTKSKEDYAKEISGYGASHINMLRVWGGGVYGDDNFYQACDKQGILVWQDFMFACAMYPGDEHFINNVKEEVKEQVLRLRNHPSLALWCGNNEIDEAWFNWGWQNQFKYSKKDSVQIWNDYQKLFHEIIPTTKNQYDKEKPYWNSSPSTGWGHPESLKEGDAHYWGVWWGMEPFNVYEKKVGRFMSEYGFQSLPDLSSLKEFCQTDELNLRSVSVKAHQKHKTGFETIQTYLERDYKTPSKFEEYVYASQLLQRDGMKIAIEAHRRNKPSCMGTLFWQLNDCWPATSWSAIDYFNQPKALYYSLKNLYNTHLVSITKEENQIKIYCVTDSIQNFEADLVIKLMNFKSEIIWQESKKIRLNNSSVEILLIDKKAWSAYDSCACYLKAELKNDFNVIAKNYFFFAKQKNIRIPVPNIGITKIDAFIFEISADVFVKDLYLYDEHQSIIFDCNYFDLEAGQKKLVKVIRTEKQKSEINLKTMFLRN